MSEKKPFPIKNWSEDDRPREKLLSKGRSALSDAELIAILIGSGNREESAVGKGIGEAKAISIAAALELGRRRGGGEALSRKHITSSKSIFELMHPLLGDLPHEEFWVIYLNNSNKVLDKLQLSKGGMTGTLVDTRIALKRALEVGAISLALVHNHPSGTLQPSEADKQVTQKLATASKSLDLRVIDHLIITEKGYFSFADEGVL